jgi:hypothetical protein
MLIRKLWSTLCYTFGFGRRHCGRVGGAVAILAPAKMIKTDNKSNQHAMA